VKKIVVTLGIFTLLTGCAGRFASTGEYVYLRSKNGTKLEVPPPLTRSNISDFYNLPPQNMDARVDITPPK